MCKIVDQKKYLIFLCSYLIFGYKKYIVGGSGSFIICGLSASLGPVSRRIGYKKTTGKMTEQSDIHKYSILNSQFRLAGRGRIS